MHIELTTTGLANGLTATNPSDDRIELDAGTAVGGNGTTFRPMQALLASLMGCSAIDVLLILEKQRKTVDKLHVAADADRRDEQPRRFSAIHLTFTASADCTGQQLQRAVELSVEKYCSVSASLHPEIALTFETVLETQ